MIRVSFITSSYNYAQYIGETIESIINQTITDWELLVIDDGSKDNSIEVIKKYCEQDKRIKLLTHPNNENRGLIASLQLGIQNSQGEYIAFVESDDYISEDYLEKKLAIFNKYTDLGFVYNNVCTFGSNPHTKLKNTLNLIEKYWSQHDYPHDISELLYFRNYIPTFSCVMLEKDLLAGLNWNSIYQPATDLWLWAQISQKTKFYFLHKKLTFWRMHSDSYLNRSKNNYKTILEFYNNLYNVLPPIKHFNFYLLFLLKKTYVTFFYTIGDLLAKKR